MKLYSPQECMGYWQKQRPIRGGQAIWLSIVECIGCAIKQDEIARELSNIRTHLVDDNVAYQKGREYAIDEFKNKLKEIYPLMYNDFGMEVNTDIHNNIDKIADQLKEKKCSALKTE